MTGNLMGAGRLRPVTASPKSTHDGDLDVMGLDRSRTG